MGGREEKERLETKPLKEAEAPGWLNETRRRGGETSRINAK